jgi:hypothetical protein
VKLPLEPERDISRDAEITARSTTSRRIKAWVASGQLVRTSGPDGRSIFTARTADVPQVCDAGAALVSLSAKSLVIPTMSLPVQSAAQGKHPRSGLCQHSGSARPREHARRCWFERWRLSDIRRRLGLPVTSMERTHGSYALIPRVRSKRPWPAASVGFTKRGWVVRVTCVLTRLSPWGRTGTTRSSWRSRAGFVNRRRCGRPFSDGSLAGP